jgi:hypothetical protein
MALARRQQKPSKRSIPEAQVAQARQRLEVLDQQYRAIANVNNKLRQGEVP